MPDALWDRIANIIPPDRPKPLGGRPRVSDRAALAGILFVLKTGIGWEHLPREMGCGSGMTCWRRLRDWHLAGVWEKLHRVLLDELGEAGRVNWERAALDASSVPAKAGAKRPPRLREVVASPDHVASRRGGAERSTLREIIL